MKKYLIVPFLVTLFGPAVAAGAPPPDTGDPVLEAAASPADIPVTPPAGRPDKAAASAQTTTTAPESPPVTPNTAPQAVSGNSDALPPPSPLYGAAAAMVSPLTPDEVRALRGKKTRTDRAMQTQTMTVVPHISTQTVALSPGSSLPLVRCAVNNACNLSFTDASGAPWPVSHALNANPTDFSVYNTRNGPLVSVVPRHPYSRGNMTVYLKGLPVPVVIDMSSGETDSNSNVWTIDSRLDLRIPRRGPSAPAMAAPESRIGLYDDTLQAFLDGTPPHEAHRLKATGDVPDTTVWQMGDDLFIRSRADILDEFEQTLSSADGMHLWKLPVTPYVTLAVLGHARPLNISLE